MAVTDFNEAWAQTDMNEGFYSHRTDDKGGETYRGISRRFNRDWPGWKIIDGYKVRTGFIDLLAGDPDLNALVREFYLALWKRMHCDDMDSQEIALQLFDATIHCGAKTATNFLQLSLNALNRDQKLWKDLEVDGIIGSKTLWTIEQAKERWHLVAKMMAGLRIAYYGTLMRSDPGQEEFAAGWLERVKV